MNNNNQQAYDRGVNMFSPDGRLYQVEYAREAVQRGSPSIGLCTESGIVLGARITTHSDLRVSDSIEKIHKIDDSIAVSSTGHVADGRKLVDQLRLLTRREELRYGELPETEQLARNMCDHIQDSTQVGGTRPYGASLLLAGVDDGSPRLFEVEPSGSPTEWKAAAVGQGRGKYMQFLEDNYEPDALTLDDGIALVVEAISEVAEDDLTREDVEVVTIAEDSPMSAVTFTDDEFTSYLATDE